MSLLGLGFGLGIGSPGRPGSGGDLVGAAGQTLGAIQLESGEPLQSEDGAALLAE
jgi:hypothetical protein